MFAWLVTIVLLESPSKVGLANMALLLPSTLLTLLGGSLADRLGARKVAIIAQALAVLPPIYLALALFFQFLSFQTMILYALAIGTLQAFVTPARDGLLNSVAGGDIQRTVVKTTLVQFTAQIVAIGIAGTAQTIGGTPILLLQAVVLAAGVFGFWNIRQVTSSVSQLNLNPVKEASFSIVAGFRTVFSNRAMRAVLIQNLGIGICFMGSYIVTVPLIIREIYHGSSSEIAFVSMMNSCGLIMTILFLLGFKRIKRPGRAMIIGSGAGSVALFFAGFGLDFMFFCVLLFLWGACGGVGMSMSRTVMQEAAPEDQRGRVMAFYSFSFMGSGPIGALLAGVTSDWLGPSITIMLACILMMTLSLLLAFKSELWNVIGSRSEQVLSSASQRFI